MPAGKDTEPMSAEMNLATPELAAVEVHGMTRGAFITRSALAAGAVYGAGAVMPFVTQALAQGSKGDIDIVNFALTLEYLETAFYTRLAKRNLTSDVKPLILTIRDDESQHVDALTATVKQLGGMPAKMPMFTFPAGDQKAMLKLAQVLEDTGVSAYNGAGPLIKDKKILGAAGSIVQVEARHAAAIRLLNGVTPAPEAFDKSLNADQVMTAVKPFIPT